MPVIYYSGPTANHRYRVEQDPANGNYALYIDVTLIDSGVLTWTSANQSQFFGETHANNDQMYGARNTPGMFYQGEECRHTSAGYSCIDPIASSALTYNPLPANYFRTVTAAAANFKIGDLACQN